MRRRRARAAPCRNPRPSSPRPARPCRRGPAGCERTDPSTPPRLRFPRSSRSHVSSLPASVCSPLQNPRVGGIEEKLDCLPFPRDGGAPIVLDLDRENEVLAHFHTVAREIADIHAPSHLAAATIVVRALSREC